MEVLSTAESSRAVNFMFRTLFDFENLQKLNKHVPSCDVRGPRATEGRDAVVSEG